MRLSHNIIIFSICLLFSDVVAQDLDLQDMNIATTEEFAAEGITTGPNFTVESSGKVIFRTNTLAIKPLFRVATGGQLHVVTGYVTSVEKEENPALPSDFNVEQNYPNPFNPETTIGYSLPEAGKVTIDIYNVLGQKVLTLLDGQQTAGVHSVHFEGGDLPSGIYFYKIQAGSHSKVMKMMLVK